MPQESKNLVSVLLGLPIFQAEWVLWVLIALSFTSVAIMAERFVFYRKHSIDASSVRA